MANPEPPQVFEVESPAVFEAEGHGAHVEHAEPIALGLTPGGWVGLSMLVFLIVLVWKGVHKSIGGGLDAKIAAIKANLDEAKQLRAEAETLRAEYAAKIAGAEKDAEAMLDGARQEAEAIVAKAEADTAATIARREQMATDKIAAAERQAIKELKARAADASTKAAASLIAEGHDAAADKALADKAIAAI
tara:strand:- start:2764 stop:3336 length:573 start_codon:yes stop_codon:yes gene_type:complete